MKIETDSGLTIDPIAEFNQLLAGTSFEKNEEVQKHLKSLGVAFHGISGTPEGQKLIKAAEGFGKSIKDEAGFKDAVKVLFRLAKKISDNPWVQFGIFIGLFGLLFALVAAVGPEALLGITVKAIARELGIGFITSGFMAIGKGTYETVSKFMGSSAEDIMIEKK